MKSRTLLVLLGAAILAIALGGCIWDPPPVIKKDDSLTYLPRTSPENVLHNLEVLYTKLDAREYDSTLADGYVFRFQSVDIKAGSPDSLTRNEEILFAENLFHNGGPTGAPPASRISLKITVGGKGADPRLEHRGLGWMKYTVSTDLTINFSDGNAMAVRSPAEFYFVQEPAGSGLWRLAEWADQPAGKPELLEVRKDYTVR